MASNHHKQHQMLLSLKNQVQHSEYVFRLSQSEGKYFMIPRLMLECARAENLFSTVNLDLEKWCGGRLRRSFRAEHIYVFS